MTEKKTKVLPVETADVKLGVKRVLRPDASGSMCAVCGKCGCRLVNVEERVKCKFCWNCGVPIIWK